MITAVVLALLAAVWLAVLVPPIVRGRGANRTDSVTSFQSQLSVLDKQVHDKAASPATAKKTHGASSVSVLETPKVAPDTKSEPTPPRPLTAEGRAKARRRQVFTALVVAVPVTLALAVLMQGWFVLAHIVVDVALIAFVSLQMRAQRISAEQEIKVAFLPHADAGAEPTMLLESVSNS